MMRDLIDGPYRPYDQIKRNLREHVEDMMTTIGDQLMPLI